jgi:predicted enzyme related to lactoylglutathione lyase
VVSPGLGETPQGAYAAGEKFAGERVDNKTNRMCEARVPVQDADRAVDFYENTLGLEVVKRDGPWAEVNANGLRIGLNGREQRGAHSSGGGPVITFQTEGSLEDAVQELKGEGVEFPAEISEHDWGRVATFKDPEGNDLQLYEPPQG